MSFKDKFKNFFSTEEEYEYVEEVEPEEVKKNMVSQKQSDKNVVSLSAVKQPNARVSLCEPRSYSEVEDIANQLLNKRAVIINLQQVDHGQAKRIIDFLSGTVYAIKGDIQKLGVHTFLCAPENVDITGSISDAIFDEDEFKKGW